MNTEIANAVNAAGDKAQYDERVKRLLSHKMILGSKGQKLRYKLACKRIFDFETRKNMSK